MLLATLMMLSGPAHALDVNAAYFGESIIHPGLKVGLEAPVLSWSVGPRKVQREIIAAGNLGLTTHLGNNTTAFSNAELGYRRTNKNGLRTEALVGAGILRTLHNNPTFTLNEDGSTERQRFAGQTGFMPSVAIGVGRDLSIKRDVPMAWFVRPTVYFQLPYNSSFAPFPALELGITRSF